MWSKLTTELTTILTTISKKETKRDKKQNAEKALFYKEKQQSMGVGIMRCEQEEKCPESSQKPKNSKRNMKI